MWRRDEVVSDMAVTLWTAVGGGDGGRRRTPSGARQAAADLAKLYEEANGRPILDLVGQVPTGDRDTPGAMLALYALGNDDAPAGLQVPSFELHYEGDELSWDGEVLAQNPAVPWSRSKVQTLLFDKTVFTATRAKEWARSHGYHHGDVDTTQRYHRVRQHETTPGAPCRTIRFTTGVMAVVCAPEADHVGNPCSCEHQNPGKANMEILVVEDDKELQRAYPRIIRKSYPTAEVFVVDRYEDAICYLKTRDIGLVVSDVDIVGGKGGIEVFQWVREHRPDLVDRYVFITGGNPQVAEMHHRFLSKPASAADITQAIRDAGASGGAPELAAPAMTRAPTRPAARTRAASAPPRTVAPPARAATAGPPTLDAVAVGNLVSEILPKVGPEGRFGQKVFVSAIWEALEREHRLPSWLTLPKFKELLVAANRARLVTLSRADLIGAMNRKLVDASEIEDRGANFHFVNDPDAKEPWEQ